MVVPGVAHGTAPLVQTVAPAIRIGTVADQSESAARVKIATLMLETDVGAQRVALSDRLLPRAVEAPIEIAIGETARSVASRKDRCLQHVATGFECASRKLR